MKTSTRFVPLLALLGSAGPLGSHAFVAPSIKQPARARARAESIRLFQQQGQAQRDEAKTAPGSSSNEDDDDDETALRLEKKRELLGLMGKLQATDSVLADPITKQAVTISVPGILFGADEASRKNLVQISSPTDRYSGSSDMFLDLLEPLKQSTGAAAAGNGSGINPSSISAAIQRAALPLVPPFLRSAMPAGADGDADSYVPMRDLFTSPAVSYAYERGWRQGFAAAGFPGPDIEATMATDYFAPAVASTSGAPSVVVDMSCATGLFTRRFAASNKYARVIGCDYSESMLTEARRRIQSDPQLRTASQIQSQAQAQKQSKTKLDLVRCDVGKIPMQDGSVDALHAGAAMHCWPDLDAAAAEIYRVLKPGGRYFATTFLSSYFSTLQAFDGDGSSDMDPSRQAFQYFASADTLRALMERGGFEPSKVAIEVLAPACVVIRCEK